MPVLEAEVLDPWQGHETESKSTSSVTTEAATTSRDLREMLAGILGYDILEAEALAAGYRELAGEALDLASASLDAQIETLPED